MVILPHTILVTDPADQDPLPSWSPFDRRHDRPWKSAMDELFRVLQEICPGATMLTDLGEFSLRLPDYRDSGCLVVPYWFGENSRNRYGLVPAMCEAVGVPFVGADAYGKIVCADKQLSKALCSWVGLKTPHGMLAYDASDLSYISGMDGPFVVKPNFDGCSLGIDYASPLLTLAEVSSQVSRILKHLGGPVLVEQFIPGREISICLMGGADSVPTIEALSWRIAGDEAYLDNRIYTASLKAHKLSIEPVPVAIDKETAQSCIRLFKMMGKVDVFRIDGRIHQKTGQFIVFELTTDFDISSGGEWSLLYGLRGKSYSDFVRDLIINSQKRCGR